MDFQHFIPGIGYRLVELGQAYHARHKGDRCLFGGKVDAGVGHPFNLL
jgi:hypothetical protein